MAQIIRLAIPIGAIDEFITPPPPLAWSKNIYCGKKCNYPLTVTQGDRFASCENIVSRSQTVLIFLQFCGVFFFTIYSQHVDITVRIKNWSPENFARKAKRPPASCSPRTVIPFPHDQTLDSNHQSSLHLQRQTGCKTVSIFSSSCNYICYSKLWERLGLARVRKKPIRITVFGTWLLILLQNKMKFWPFENGSFKELCHES